MFQSLSAFSSNVEGPRRVAIVRGAVGLDPSNPGCRLPSKVALWCAQRMIPPAVITTQCQLKTALNIQIPAPRKGSDLLTTVCGPCVLFERVLHRSHQTLVLLTDVAWLTGIILVLHFLLLQFDSAYGVSRRCSPRCSAVHQFGSRGEL